METTIDHLKGKPSDFKLCAGCGAFNWHENEACHNCGRSDLFDDFTPIVEWKATEYIHHLKDSDLQSVNNFPVRV